jgi:hypothetical protein
MQCLRQAARYIPPPLNPGRPRTGRKKQTQRKGRQRLENQLKHMKKKSLYQSDNVTPGLDSQRLPRIWSPSPDTRVEV